MIGYENDPTYNLDRGIDPLDNIEPSSKPGEYDDISIWGKWAEDQTGDKLQAWFLFLKEMRNLDHSEEEIAEMWEEYQNL